MVYVSSHYPKDPSCIVAKSFRIYNKATDTVIDLNGASNANG